LLAQPLIHEAAQRFLAPIAPMVKIEAILQKSCTGAEGFYKEKAPHLL
jgi:hypothetical protein